MKEFYRVMLGRGSMYAKEWREKGFIGAGFNINQVPTKTLPENQREIQTRRRIRYLDH